MCNAASASGPDEFFREPRTSTSWLFKGGIRDDCDDDLWEFLEDDDFDDEDWDNDFDEFWDDDDLDDWDDDDWDDDDWDAYWEDD